MKEKFLRELADIQTGPFGSQLHKEDYVADGTPIVTVEHLGNKMFSEQNLPRVSNTDKNRLKKYVLKQGDIVFSRVGSVDRCSYVDQKHDGWMFSGRCLRVRPTSEIDSEYLYYYFCLEETKQFVRNISVGATMPSINTKLLGEVVVTFPELEQQKRISGILSAIDSKIEVNQKINDNLLRQAQALYKNRFIDLKPFNGEMPPDWQLGTVSEIIELHDSKRIPLSSRERANLTKIYPYYGATSVMDYVDRYLFDGIYLLLGEDGTVVDDKGFPILQYVEGKFWVNNHAHIITGKNGFTVETLYLLFSLTNVRSIVTGAVQPKISQANLNNVSVVIPSKAELSTFNSIVQPIFSQIRNLRAESDRLTATRDILLPRLMSGEIDAANIQL